MVPAERVGRHDDAGTTAVLAAMVDSGGRPRGRGGGRKAKGWGGAAQNTPVAPRRAVGGLMKWRAVSGAEEGFLGGWGGQRQGG